MNYWKVIEIVSSGLNIKLTVIDLLVVKCKKRNSKIILGDIIQCILEWSRYYMEPEKLEDLFNTEHLDVVQAMLVGLKAVEEKRSEERDREHSKLMASRPPTIERCSFSVEILGWRQWW